MVRIEQVELVDGSSDQVTLLIDGVQRVFDVHRVGKTCYVDSVLGCTTLQRNFPVSRRRSRRCCRVSGRTFAWSGLRSRRESW